MAKHETRPTLRSYLLCYLSYAALIALVVIVTFVIWRRTVLNLLLAINTRPEANTLLYFVSMVLMGLVGFIVVITAEPYLRTGLERGLLWRRLMRLAIPFVVAGLIGIIVNLWALSTIAPPASTLPIRGAAAALANRDPLRTTALGGG